MTDCHCKMIRIRKENKPILFHQHLSKLLKLIQFGDNIIWFYAFRLKPPLPLSANCHRLSLLLSAIAIVEECSRLDVRKYSYTVRMANEWNKVNPDAKKSRSVPIFKNALTKHFNHTGLEEDSQPAGPEEMGRHEPHQMIPQSQRRRRWNLRLKYK